MSTIKTIAAAFFILLSTPALSQTPKVVVIPLGGGNEMTVITAVISSNVTVVRSNDPGLGVNRAGGLVTGDYVVTTSTNIATCTYMATLGGPVSGIGPDAGEITVRPSTSGSNNVFIQTKDSSGTSADLGFHLIIMCG